MSNFMGYGSPEKLEEAINASESEEFTVYSEGLCFASVCSTLSQEETERRMAQRLCGTTNGWTLADGPFETGQPNLTPCNNNPTTHMHYLFEA